MANKKQLSKRNYEIQTCTEISDTLSAVPIVSHGDYKKAMHTVFTAIQKACDLLGINIEESFLAMLTEDVIDKYKHDSIEDLIFCIKKGRQGYYGTTYNKMNMVVITEWMEKYLDQKSAAREKMLKNKMIEQEEERRRSLSHLKNGEKEGEFNVDYQAFKERIKPKKTTEQIREENYKKFRDNFPELSKSLRK